MKDSAQLDPLSIATVAATQLFEDGANVARLVCGNCNTRAMFANFFGALIPVAGTIGDARIKSATIPYCSNCTQHES